MNVQETDLGDLRIDLGNPSDQKGYGSTAQSTQPKNDAPHVEREEAPKPARTGFFSCLSVEFYQPYFDVTTEDVKQRILSTVDPRKNTFFETLDNRPDLYGPFWIYTTLIFALAACGNFSNLIRASANGQAFQSRFNFIPIATSVIYGFGIVVPIIFTFLLRLFGSKVNYVDTVCIYGYSTFILIPVLIVAIIPMSVIQWIVLMYGFASSTWFLLNNYAHETKKYVGNQRYILLGFIGASQFVLLLVFRLKFFSDIYATSA